MIAASNGTIINCKATKESGLSAPVAATIIARIGKSLVRRDWGELAGKGGRVLYLTVGRLFLVAGIRVGLYLEGLYLEGLDYEVLYYRVIYYEGLYREDLRGEGLNYTGLEQSTCRRVC